MSYNARNSDPTTSHNAADDDHGKRRDRAIVWQLFLQRDPIGIDDYQLGLLLGGDKNGKWRKRRSDLARDGFLIDTGQRAISPISRRELIVWGVNRDQVKQQAKQLPLDL